MSEGHVPSPDFDETKYERPNKDWVCGHACDGCPCRIGPSPSGKCRATTECSPRLETAAGEEKGTWKCTRPRDWGGPCEHGPLPDGTCCKSIPRCQPARSLRARRGLVTRAVVTATAALLLLGLAGNVRESFVNPAPLSRAHSGRDFARLAASHGGGQGCVLCHVEARQGFGGVVTSAVHAAQASLNFATFTTPHPKDFSRMDQSCAACHQAQSFHEANVVHDTSCSLCHVEHQGSGAMAAVAMTNCTDCHGDQAQMTAAALKGRTLPAALFVRDADPGVIAQPAPRPTDGYTHVIHAFATDHPEFQVRREALTDTNSLKFNHRLHLTGDVPMVEGRRLDCAYCHQPDAAGAFMRRTTFEQSCRACHALNFDENNPGLTLPHGDATFARAFLRSLPTQYADYATRRLGLTRQNEIDAFVSRQMAALRTRTLAGENLERAVFFADASTGEATTIAGVTGPARAKFAGCAYCHEVTPHDNAAPGITPPRTTDRWMLHSRFDHSKHALMQCSDCHAAEASTRTADVIMPTQKSCTECHSPKGGVASECSTCHVYHNDPPAGLTALLKPAPTR